MDLTIQDEDMVTVWIGCVDVGSALPNEQVRLMTVGQLMDHFGGSLKLRAREEETTWLTFQDILDGYFDRIRGFSGDVGSSERDSVETVSLRGAEHAAFA